VGPQFVQALDCRDFLFGPDKFSTSRFPEMPSPSSCDPIPIQRLQQVVHYSCLHKAKGRAVFLATCWFGLNVCRSSKTAAERQGCPWPDHDPKRHGFALGLISLAASSVRASLDQYGRSQLILWPPIADGAQSCAHAQLPRKTMDTAVAIILQLISVSSQKAGRGTLQEPAIPHPRGFRLARIAILTRIFACCHAGVPWGVLARLGLGPVQPSCVPPDDRGSPQWEPDPPRIRIARCRIFAEQTPKPDQHREKYHSRH